MRMSDRRLLLNLLTSCFFLGAAQSVMADRPNILFLFADDQCYETIAALGHPRIETPNLDRLVRDGLSFTRAYNMGSWSGAVCVASRTMLNTGRQVWNAHRLVKSLGAERQAGRFWSDQMRAAGYRTYMTGKWHVATPASEAFDVVGHVRGGMPRTVEAAYNRPLTDKADTWSPFDRSLGGFWEGGKHWSEVVADDAVGFLRTAAQREEPFFMYLAFNAPHDPRQSPQEFVDRYPTESIRLPTNFLPSYPYKDDIGCSPNLRDERLAPFPRTQHAVQVHRQEYYAIITHMDRQIGRILNVLEDTGQQDNTYIFFTADHGLAVGHHGLFGKQNMYEHSVRVPFMVVGPTVPENKRVDTPIYLQDIMPTTIELAGRKVPDFVEFDSLVPHLQRKTDASHRDAVYGAYLEFQRMVTMDDYKLIIYPKIERLRLYHLKNDPDEQFDLAERPESQSIIQKLLSRFVELQAENGDTLDVGDFINRGRATGG